MEVSGNVTKVTTEIGRATKALVSAGENLAKIMTSVQVFTTEAANIAEKIEVKSAELGKLDEDYEDKLRKHKIDLGFLIQENEEVQLQKLLDKKEVIAVKPSVVKELEAQVSALTAAKDKAVKDAVEANTKELTSKHSAEITKKELEHTAETAETKAELNALKSKCEYLEEALKIANKSLDDERKARIEIASKSGHPVINVGSTK